MSVHTRPRIKRNESFKMKSFSQVRTMLLHKGERMAICVFSFHDRETERLPIPLADAPFLRCTRIGEEKEMPIRNGFLHEAGFENYVRLRPADYKHRVVAGVAARRFRV